MRPEPEHRIPQVAIKAWRITGVAGALFLWLAPAFLAVLTMQGEGPSWWIVYILFILVVILTILSATILPSIRWKRWRYQIDEHEIDLRHGIFIVRRTLIPVKRVQHVDTRQGPVLRHFGLSTVAITTAATTHEIPALDDETADEVRNQISNFARLAEEDV